MHDGVVVERGRVEALSRPAAFLSKQLLASLPARRAELPTSRSGWRTRLMSGSTSPLLRVTSLRKEFGAHRSVLGRLGGPAPDAFVAVRDVSLTVSAGETLAVVGESGSGKSTLGRMILELIQPTSGVIEFDGRDITELPVRSRRELSRDIQVIFQDPYASLNPRQRVEDIIREPLDIHRIGSRVERQKRVHELMDRVSTGPAVPPGVSP